MNQKQQTMKKLLELYWLLLISRYTPLASAVLSFVVLLLLQLCYIFLLAILWQVGSMPCLSYWIVMASVSLLDLEQWYALNNKAKLFKAVVKINICPCS